MADLVVLIPMLGRPHRVEPLLESITATCDADVLFACTPGDSAVDAVEAAGHKPLLVDRQPRGDYARKIQAGIDATRHPYLFTGADDLRFHPGWLERALARMDGRVGVVGTNDLCNKRTIRGEHATHFLVARWYVARGTIDHPGHLFHHGYVHEFVDDELVGTAKHRGAWAFARDSIVEHLHPMAGKAPVDDLYSRQAARIRAGRDEFTRRSPLWT